jgi:cellobiose-specific phosphotransferase system component IIC
MNHLLSSPMLGDVIWIGGGGLGLVVLIIIIVLVLRR